MKNYTAFGLGNGTQATHQVALVMASTSSIQPISTSASTPPSCSSNFSSNPYWIPPNFSHSIFSAQVVDRHAYKSDTWIIDIGATDHMVHSVTQLTTVTSIIQSCVYLPNGEEALVTHIGTLQISSTLALTSVLCVPSFSLNLIFVSKFTIYFCCLIFLGDCCFIQDLAQWSMIGLGKESNRLYLLQDSNSRNAPTTLTTNVGHTSPSNLWYHRLGHPSCSKLALLKQIIQFDISNKATCCDVCHYSKQKRLPFTPSAHVSSKPFELIHCDL